MRKFENLHCYTTPDHSNIFIYGENPEKVSVAMLNKSNPDYDTFAYARLFEYAPMLLEALEVVCTRVQLEKDENPDKTVMLGAVLSEYQELIKKIKG